jgi:hypothetical protein
MITTFKEQKTTRRIESVVQDQQGHPMADVLVEVYDHPEIMLRGLSRDVTGQTRIAACTTNSAGLFALEVPPDAPPGRYELRFSESKEFNVTTIPLKVEGSARPPKKKIVVSLMVGT